MKNATFFSIKWRRIGAAFLLPVILLGLAACGNGKIQPNEEVETSATFAMDTLIEQRAYGGNAQKAMTEVNRRLAAWESQFSLFTEGGDIARVNEAAGQGGAEVSPETAELLAKAVALAPSSKGAFAITVGPLTKAWGVTTETPRVPPQEEIDRLLQLVDDSALEIDGTHVALPQQGMSIDLGGIAKGAACTMVKQVYEEYGLSGALLSIGGNVFAFGEKPGGVPFRVGFRDPNRSDGSYIASIQMKNQVIAVSGGYERYFEQDGKRYIHIINPQTGYPAESDIVSVGVIHEDGMVADFWSTTLFIWGKDKTLDFMQQGNSIIMLDEEGNLYVSEALKDTFKLNADAGNYNVVYVPKEAA